MEKRLFYVRPSLKDIKSCSSTAIQCSFRIARDIRDVLKQTSPFVLLSQESEVERILGWVTDAHG